ncbi:MAG TPA: hypothetical protein VFS08_05225 [Gemmatimonadaceae bacterium]|nr:hypothetical protein [Gemmatimonadaceae bacterium]
MPVRRFDAPRAPRARPTADRSLRARLRGVGLWFVTGFDDIVVERCWGRLRRGDVRGALRVWTELLFGFWGCAVVPLALAAVIALIVAAAHGPRAHGPRAREREGGTPRPASALQGARPDRR